MSRLYGQAGLAVAACVAAPAHAQEIAGPWHGVLVIGPNVLRIVVRVTPKAGGGYQGELASPDQRPKSVPLGEVSLAGDKASFTAPAIGGRFDGSWDAGKTAWAGQWKQGPMILPLILTKGEAEPLAVAAPVKPAKTVEGVTVTGQSQAGMRSDIDRRSYDITNDLQAQAGSLADVLRDVPSVEVDVQGNVSLRGDPNVTIMVDGKPSSLFKGPSRGQILQQLPAGSFERVEVMTNPSAAFRPDGGGGIINLIPKKARQIGATGSVRVDGSTNNREGVGLNLNRVGAKLTLTGDLNVAHEDQSATVADRRLSLDPNSGEFLASSQDYRSDTEVNVAFARAAFDYDPDRRTRISGELRAVSLDIESDYRTRFAGAASGGAPEIYDRTGAPQMKRNDLAVNGSWRRKFGSDPDHKVMVDLTRERTTERRDAASALTSLTPVLPSYAEAIRYAFDQDQTHLKTDYARPIGDEAKLKAGYELEYDRDRFDNFGRRGPIGGPPSPAPSLIDLFRFNQAINGVYVTYQQPVAGLTLLAGLRLEDTHIDLRDVTTAYRGENKETRLYPSLHVTRKFGDTDQLTASYSERIQRPQPSEYNPFRVYQDPFNYRAGNPNLKPQQTHSYELAYQHRPGTTYYLATLYWRQNAKVVTDVVRDLGGGVFLTTKENLSESRTGGVELVANVELTPKLVVQSRSDVFWNEIDGGNLGFANRRSAWSVSGGATANWQLTPKDLLQISANVTGKRLTPQGYYEPSGMLNVGYRHKINEDWSLFVSARDVLGTFRQRLVIDTPTLKDRNETRPRLSAVFLGFTYAFGKGPRKDPGIDYGSAGAATK